MPLRLTMPMRRSAQQGKLAFDRGMRLKAIEGFEADESMKTAKLRVRGTQSHHDQVYCLHPYFSGPYKSISDGRRGAYGRHLVGLVQLGGGGAVDNSLSP